MKQRMTGQIGKAVFGSFLLLLLWSIGAAEDKKADGGPITQGLRIYYTGHSFIMFIPPYMDEFASAAGISGQVKVGGSSLGGSSVLQHWDVGSKGKLPLADLQRIYGKEVTESMVADEQNLVKKALRTGQVDVLTTAPLFKSDEGIEKFAKLALEHNPNIRITVEQIWLRRGDAAEPVPRDYPHAYKSIEDYNTAAIAVLRERSAAMFKSIDDCVAELNKKIGKPVLFVVPTGQAVIALREKIVAGKAGKLKTQSALFTDLTGHGTEPLKVLVAYCHYAVIYRRTPVGLPMPKGLAKNWDAETLQVLQEVAWEAVTQHPLSGVHKTPADKK
jgi:hypothetical protein